MRLALGYILNTLRVFRMKGCRIINVYFVFWDAKKVKRKVFF